MAPNLLIIRTFKNELETKSIEGFVNITITKKVHKSTNPHRLANITDTIFSYNSA